MRLTPYPEGDEYIWDIDLNKPATERWCHHSLMHKRQIRALLKDVVDHSIAHLDRLPGYIQPLVKVAAKGTARLSGRLVDMVAGMFGQEYVQEIRSVSACTRQPLSYVMLGNLIYDLMQFGEQAGFGCSSYSCNIGGKPTLVRNMDWVVPRSTGAFSRVLKFHRGEQHYLSVSVLGCVGVVSAMCPGKWAVTLNQAPTNGTSPGVFQWPVLQRLRHCCDKMGSYDELVADLQEYCTMTSFFAHVIGTEPDQHTVITGLGSEFWQRDREEPCLIQTNHFVGEELEEKNPPEEWQEGDDWYYNDTYRRMRALTKRLKRPPGSLATARKKLAGSPVTTTDTMQQMVFQPATGQWSLWTRQ
jgi:hypothetical protein